MEMNLLILRVVVAMLLFVGSCSAGNVHKMKFYMHDILTGDNTTAVFVGEVKSQAIVPPLGITAVVDDPLTEEPSLTSRIIGRAKGMYMSAANSASDVDFQLILSFVFLDSSLNGSSVQIRGADHIFEKKREVSIVGGTGLFRFAQGYAVIRTAETRGINATLKVNLKFVVP